MPIAEGVNLKPKKMGRPPLPEDKRKGRYIRFVLTNEERAMLDALSAAHDKTMSELLRGMIATCYAVDVKKGVIPSDT